jgi:hypothetical protein
MVTPRNPMVAAMMGAITARSSDRIAAFDMSAAPLPPPSGSGAVNPGDLGTQAAINAVMQAEALENIDQVISALQDQIDVLNATVNEQGEQIARVTAAVKSFDCPIHVMNPYYKDKVASVDVCMDQGLCTCDVGYALRMPGDGYSETSSSQGE